MDDAQTRPRALNLPERVQLAKTLAAHGLGHVRLPGLTIDEPPCMGKQNGCIHDCCTGKPEPAVGGAPQPWNPRPAKHAKAA